MDSEELQNVVGKATDWWLQWQKEDRTASITATAKRFAKAIFPLVAVTRYTAATTAQSSEKNVEPRCGFAKTAVFLSATMAQNRIDSFFFMHTMV